MTEQKPEQKHIIRIAQVDLVGGKPIGIALRKIKGIGFNLAHAICNLNKIDHQKKAGSLNDEEVKKLTETIQNPKDKLPGWMFNRQKDYETGEDKHVTTGELDFVQDNSIKLLRKIRCYRGLRHSQKRPVRGQRTKSNFRGSKGKVVGVAKKKGVKKGK